MNLAKDKNLAIGQDRRACLGECKNQSGEGVNHGKVMRQQDFPRNADLYISYSAPYIAALTTESRNSSRRRAARSTH